MVPTMTAINVVMMPMPIELISARVNSDVEKIPL